MISYRGSKVLSVTACYAIVLSTSPALCQEQDGWNLFKIWRVYGGHSVSDASECVQESYGAVVNGCSYDVGLTFGLATTTMTLTRIIALYASGPTEFQCYGHAFFYDNAQFTSYTTSAPIDVLGQTLGSTVVTVPNNNGQNDSFHLALYCDNIPPNGRIEWIRWTG